ncbi:MAG: hypothetical protein AABY83_03430 [Pseudomonadota bacterium]
MKKNLRWIVIATLLLPFSVSAAVCEQYWLHLGGVSKHVEVYPPKPYTKYRRQTHPGVGLECQGAWMTLSGGQFTNSLDHDFRYLAASKDLGSLVGITLYAGLMGARYGRDQGPLNLVMPSVYVEYQYKYLGINLFALPPAEGWNDYLVLFAQLKLGF